ncbi:hypothetical protein [Paraflavitalea sp. CAU 1676]|uniref:hypothetical protein n=1 Tax=Paraflavitalea sp. CAU 1676 TaxID=3032598 RepID=UPI0023D98387|nr:hypothetical protein [Paraflavitalea sp. CAU 1676]MDF2191690.1 hypothetical protein [Paraflavitalea sp. CAU 1676]
MRRNTKMLVMFSTVIIIAAGLLYLQMRGFAEGVIEDSKKHNGFADSKLGDSTVMIFKKVE